MSETAEAPAAENVNLNVTDIANAVRCIDYAAEQGAFKGWDTMEKVLFIRNRLQAFVAAASPAPAEGETAEAPAEAVG